VRCLTLAAVSAAVSAPENRLHLVRRRRGPQRAEYGNFTRPTEPKYRDTKADVEVGTRDLKTAAQDVKSGFLDCGLETRGQETRKAVEESTIVAKLPDTPLGRVTG
jgi:hypothetical protein